MEKMVDIAKEVMNEERVETIISYKDSFIEGAKDTLAAPISIYTIGLNMIVQGLKHKGKGSLKRGMVIGLQSCVVMGTIGGLKSVVKGSLNDN